VRVGGGGVGAAPDASPGAARGAVEVDAAGRGDAQPRGWARDRVEADGNRRADVMGTAAWGEGADLPVGVDHAAEGDGWARGVDQAGARPVGAVVQPGLEPAEGVGRGEDVAGVLVAGNAE